jgi:hypothetical protein
MFFSEPVVLSMMGSWDFVIVGLKRARIYIPEYSLPQICWTHSEGKICCFKTQVVIYGDDCRKNLIDWISCNLQDDELALVAAEFSRGFL